MLKIFVSCICLGNMNFNPPNPMKIKHLILAAIACVICSCVNCELKRLDATLDEVTAQTMLMVQEARKQGMSPRTVNKDGSIHWIDTVGSDWTEGFFPGTLWYLYEYTGDTNFKKQAEFFQNLFHNQRHVANNHDLGFIFNTSYGNAYRLTQNEEFKQTVIDAADALITRFDPRVGLIKSWNANKGWQAKRGWEYPVIIDNMMNLELLFEASELTGDDKYKKVAMSHADMTLKNHYRKDFSSYHLVDYDSVTGDVRSKQTAQGYAHESVWARGQAWGLYGCLICYRYTQEVHYLATAEKIANFIMGDVRIPSDKVPYWDYDASKTPNEPRDASAAACTASAIMELVKYADNPEPYFVYGKDLLKSLSSERYRAEVGTNNYFVLKHSVGSVPHNAEINVPLNYADYYYIEALLRLRDLLD